MKTAGVAALCVLLLGSAEAVCTCKALKTKLNDGTDPDACRALSSAQTAPEMMSWMLQALKVQKATQSILSSTVTELCAKANLPCKGDLEVMDMSIVGVPSDVPMSAYVDCYLDQIEILASPMAQAMSTAYRKAVASGNVTRFNKLAVKGIHTDGDFIVGCTHTNVTQSLEIQTSMRYTDFLGTQEQWKDHVLNSTEINSLAKTNPNASTLMQSIIKSQADMLGIADTKYITIDQVTRKNSKIGRRLQQTDAMALAPSFKYSGDALTILATNAATNRFFSQ